jgi:hypothetical protein
MPVMGESGESRDKNRVREKAEQRLARWECLVIKCFAILFLILFLSEKAVREVGSIRRAWVTEVAAPLDNGNRYTERRGCQSVGGETTWRAAGKGCCQKSQVPEARADERTRLQGDGLGPGIDP